MSRRVAWSVVVCPLIAFSGHLPAQPADSTPPSSAAAALVGRADDLLEKNSAGEAVNLYLECLSRYGAVTDRGCLNRLWQACQKDEHRHRDVVVATLRDLVQRHPEASAALTALEMVGRGDGLFPWRFGEVPAVVRPGSEIRVGVESNARLYQLGETPKDKLLPKYSLYRIPGAAHHEALSSLIKWGHRPALYQLEDAWQRIPPADRQPVKVSAALFGLEPDESPPSVGDDVLTADVRTPGLYVLEQEIDGFHRRHLVRVASFGLLCQSLGGQTLIYSVDPWTGEPVPGIDVLLQTEKVISATRTNKQGLAFFDVPKATGNDQAILVASRGDESVSCAVDGSSRQATEEHVYVTTDRPIYRPGQRVHFKAVSRQRDGAALKRPPRRAVPVEIRDDEGRVLQRQELTWNEFGSLSGTFQLAEEPRLGTYYVVIGVKQPARRLDPQQYEGDEAWRALWQQSFRVEAYRKPEFAVQVQAAAPATGAKGRATIQAEYYFGGPVAEAEVTWRVRSAWADEPGDSHWQVMPWDDPRRWFYEGQAALTAEEDSSPSWFSQQRTTVASGAGRTGKDGRLEITFEATTFQTSPRAWPVEYRVEADVRDASRLTARGEARVDVRPADFRLQVGTTRRFYEPGDTITVGVTATAQNGQPAAGREVALTLFMAAEGSGGKEFESFFSTKVRTDAQGRGQVQVKAPHAGILRLRAQLRDDQGRLAQQRCDLWVAGDAAVEEDPDVADRDKQYRTTSHGREPPHQVMLLSDRLAYEPGEKVRLLVRCTRLPCAGLLTVGAGTWREERVVHLTRKCEIIELTVPADAPPYVKVDLTTWQQGNVAGDVADFFVYPAKHVLDVQVATDRPQYAPRETAEVTVQSRTTDGQAAASEVELAIVDESIFSLAKDRALDPRVFFYAAYPVDTDVSQQIVPDPLAWGTAGSSSGFSASRFLGYSTQAPFVISVIPVEGDTGGPPRGGAGRGFFGGGMGGAGGGKALAATETRVNLADTWHWSAHVRTGADGKAKLSLKAPDTLSKWRIVARAISGDGHFGWTKSETVTRKDVLVRLVAPRFYTQGDEGTVSTIVHNDLAASAEFLVRLTVHGAEGGGERTVTIPAHSQQRLDWTLKIVHTAPVELKAEALSTAASDAMMLTLPVRPYGVRMQVAQSGMVSPQWMARLTVPKDANPETMRLAVYTGGLNAAIRDALPHLAEYPYGCVEQTMSRFLPAVVAAGAFKRLGTQDRELEAKLPDIVHQGLQRLYGFHHSDGGWGWWEKDASHDFMTAYVMYGLIQARQAGYHVDPKTFDGGLAYLRNAKDTPFALYVRHLAGDDVREAVGECKTDVLEEQAWLVLAGQKKLAAKLRLRPKDDPGPNDIREAALVIRALASVDRQDARITPLVEWLMSQRRGGIWFSTLDTAYVVIALADLAQVEREPVIEARLNGKPLVARAGQIQATASELRGGENVLEVRSTGGAVFASAILSYFTNDVEAAAGPATPLPSRSSRDAARPILERRFEKEVVRDGRTQWQPLASGESVEVSQRLRVVLSASATKAVYRVMIESPIAAGSEPREKMDEKEDEETWSYWYCRRELRDDRVSVATPEIDKSPQTFEFYLRPTLPGVYHALPAEAFDMYEPARRGLSAPFVLRVIDRGKGTPGAAR